MQLFRSLQFKVGTGIVGTVALLFAVYLVWDYQFQRRQFLAELEDTAGSLSRVISNSLIKVEMAGRHPELLQESIEQIGNDPPIVGIYLLDGRGNVRFASNPGLRGRTLNLADEGCRDCHAPGADKRRSTFVELSGVQKLRNVVAIQNRPECHGCHFSGDRLIGILVVDLEAESVKGKLRAGLDEMLVKAAMTIFAILAALGLLMSRLVTTRLKRLTVHTGLLVEEWADPAPKAIEGADEIGQLGAAFNRMVDRLEQYRRDVKVKEELRVMLLEKFMRVQEGERKRISRELHDHVGQSLSALLLACQGHERGSADAGGGNDELRGRILGLIDDVHQLAWEMRPSVLDDYGLDAALQTYVDDIAKRHGIPIDYQSSARPGTERLPGGVEAILYRVAQEALTNVVRHSQANRASVVLLRQTDDATLLIEDDGCGFDSRFPQNGRKGLGLIGMRERVRLCGGSCVIESALKCGTTVRVKIPLGEGSA